MSGARARVGISGWTYAPWRSTFYPKGLAHKNELRYASERLDSIELNGSFYALQRPSSYRHWAEETPDDFVFSIKGGRYVTHIRRLQNPTEALSSFFASGLLTLGDKLGPLLWQLPPNLQFDSEPGRHLLRDAAAHDNRCCGARAHLDPRREPHLDSGHGRPPASSRHRGAARRASSTTPSSSWRARTASPSSSRTPRDGGRCCAR